MLAAVWFVGKSNQYRYLLICMVIITSVLYVKKLLQNRALF